MTTDGTENLVRRFVDRVWNQRKLTHAEEVVADATVLHDLTRGVEYGGPEGVKNFHRLYLAAIPDASVEVEALVADGEDVVTRWVLTGTHQGDLMGLSPTGNDIRVPAFTMATVVDGTIREMWVILSLFRLLEQLDAAPEFD